MAVVYMVNDKTGGRAKVSGLSKGFVKALKSSGYRVCERTEYMKVGKRQRQDGRKREETDADARDHGRTSPL